jgi:hypothetical protein
MKCPICGKQTLPGAKLCSPCRAALKRAKDDSVWELPASQRRGEAATGQAQPEADDWVLGSPRASTWRTWAVAAGALVVVAGIGVRWMHGTDAAPPPIVEISAPARAVVTEPAAAAVQRALPASTQPASVEERSRPVSEPHVAQPPRGGDHPASPRPKASKPVADSAPAPVAPALDPPALIVPVVTPPQPEPVRPVDPWQRMSDALARCRGQELFGRLGCEYRVRASYCEGHWGEVAQCPAGVTNDHGQ